MRRTRVAAGAAVLAMATGIATASTVLGLSIEDQTRLSRHVVLGVVTGQQGVDHPENGLETAVTLRVLEDFKGNLGAGDSLVFHTRSGSLDGESSEAIGEAVFHTGRMTLVFIEEVDGRLYNLGLSMGVWDVAEGKKDLVLTRALRDGLMIVGEDAVEPGPLTLRDLKSRVALAVRQPAFDNLLLREHFGTAR